MNKAIGMAAAFIFGAAAGAAGAWYFCKTKYERIAQEEIESVKTVFSEKAKFDTSKAPVDHQDESEKEHVFTTSDLTKNKEFHNMYGYMTKTDNEDVPKAQNDIPEPRPFIITPSEYGDQDDYELVALNYYRDHILVADVDNEIIEDVDDIIGFESLNHFGENEEDPDVIFVRNDKHMCDFEVHRDPRSYEESRDDYL